MKTIRRWLFSFLVLFVFALIALILAKDAIFKALAERSLHESTGLRAEIGEFTTRLGSGAFQLRDLKLYNAAEFGGTLLASVPELAVDLDTAQAADGILHFRQLKLNLTELHVIKNLQGRWNLEGVEKTVREHLHKRKRKKGEKLELEFGGIDQAQLSVGRIFYCDLQTPSRSCNFDLAMKDEVLSGLKTEEDLQAWAGAMLFRVFMQRYLKPSAKATDPTAPTARNAVGLGEDSKGLAPAVDPRPEAASPLHF